MVSTIQISNEVKNDLKRLKKSNKDTYEDVIIDLIIGTKNKDIQKLAVEGYKEMAEENLKIQEEFKYVDAENLPEWKR